MPEELTFSISLQLLVTAVFFNMRSCAVSSFTGKHVELLTDRDRPSTPTSYRPYQLCIGAACAGSGD